MFPVSSTVMIIPTASLVYINSSVTEELNYLIPVSSNVMTTPTASLVQVSSSITEELYNSSVQYYHDYTYCYSGIV